MLELQTRTVRGNLVFFNIPEKKNEKPEDTEKILYEFIEHDMKVDSKLTKSINFEGVHRSGPVDRKKMENCGKLQFSQGEGNCPVS